MADRKKMDDKEEEIRKLKEKLKELEEASAKGNEEEAKGIVGGILGGVGKMIPGLEGLLKSLGRSPAVKQRLEEAEKEMERRLREAPSGSTQARSSVVTMGIPPGARGRVTRRRRFVKERSGPQKRQPPKPKEQAADIFDEKDHIKVIAEIPGVEENDIRIDLENDSLTISVDSQGQKYGQQLKLPCEPKGEVEKSYRNGVLELTIKKQH